MPIKTGFARRCARQCERAHYGVTFYPSKVTALHDLAPWIWDHSILYSACAMFAKMYS
jgi:hypothetical protein